MPCVSNVRGARRIGRVRAKGRKVFQVSIISWSYRIRGSVARVRMNRVAIRMLIMRRGRSPSGVPPVEKNIALVKMLTIKILAYSAMKMRANPLPPYSILNPETSSDSPSAKSKGARFVSARRVVNQAVMRGGARKRVHETREKRGVVKFMLFRRMRVLRRKRAILTS